MAPTSDSDSAGSGVMYADNLKGFLLALLSSAFIGASFIIKKKGLKRAASSCARAGILNSSYLLTLTLIITTTFVLLFIIISFL